MKRTIEQTYAALTIDSAKETAVVTAPSAKTIAYVVVASAASSPTGTTIQLQGSLDGTNFVNIGSAVTVTGNGSFSVSAVDPVFEHYKLVYTRTSGSYIATTSILIKEAL